MIGTDPCMQATIEYRIPSVYPCIPTYHLRIGALCPGPGWAVMCVSHHRHCFYGVTRALLRRMRRRLTNGSQARLGGRAQARLHRRMGGGESGRGGGREVRRHR